MIGHVETITQCTVGKPHGIEVVCDDQPIWRKKRKARFWTDKVDFNLDRFHLSKCEIH